MTSLVELNVSLARHFGLRLENLRRFELVCEAGELPKITAEYLVHRPSAKLSVSPDFEWCSDEFRERMNAWLRERFGTIDKLQIENNKFELRPVR